MSPGLLAGLLVALGYLSGSVSFAYLAGRLRRAIDLREYGSRKLSSSNVYHYMGVGWLVLVGILDLAKAAGPVWLSIRLGCAPRVTVLVGLAAMVGHNWPIFLGFRGGRGISTALGLLVCVFPRGALWLLVWLAASRLTPRIAALPALLGLAGLPFLALWLGKPISTIWGCWGILALTLLKRLEGNRQPLPPGEAAWRVFLRRLLLDRDIADLDAWSSHQPAAEV